MRGIRSPGEKVLRNVLTEKVVSEQRLEREEGATWLARGRAYQ